MLKAEAVHPLRLEREALRGTRGIGELCQRPFDAEVMKRHGVSTADLMGGPRMEQVAHVENVGLATSERGGKISLVPRGKA
ncbi:hypothetical protein ACLIMP_22635 [Novosphingobium aerophilum]|uniref:hypothetical protein n=1 Tax=Novosphingobium aerophilum TaxID=2839843 RepID=UPI001C8F4FC6